MAAVAAAPVQYLAPAKLNLFLHITGRRADGFHDLETVFQLVDLADTVTVETRSDSLIRREPAPSDPLLASLADEADLTIRAARLLQQHSGSTLGANIHVHKRIPAGGGMGGGSSDAATVLRALNQQWGLHWPVERLAALGLQLGSDVPVFVHGHNAFARGRGEQLQPLDLPASWYLVVHPGVSVATGEIFGAAELTRDTPPLKIPGLPPGGGHNDCEPAVRARYPAVAQALDMLSAHQARLTGTGACVFVATATQQAAQQLAHGLPAAWRSYVVRSLV